MKITNDMLKEIVLEEERKVLSSRTEQQILQEGILDLFARVFQALFGWLFGDINTSTTNQQTQFTNTSDKNWQQASQIVSKQTGENVKKETFGDVSKRIIKNGKFANETEYLIMMNFWGLTWKAMAELDDAHKLMSKAHEHELWNAKNPKDEKDVEAFVNGDGDYAEAKKYVQALSKTVAAARVWSKNIKPLLPAYKKWDGKYKIDSSKIEPSFDRIWKNEVAESSLSLAQGLKAWGEGSFSNFKKVSKDLPGKTYWSVIPDTFGKIEELIQIVAESAKNVPEENIPDEDDARNRLKSILEEPKKYSALDPDTEPPFENGYLDTWKNLVAHSIKLIVGPEKWEEKNEDWTKLGQQAIEQAGFSNDGRLPEDGNLEEAVQKLEELLSKLSIDADTKMDPPLSKLFANAIKILEEAPEEAEGGAKGKKMTKAEFAKFAEDLYHNGLSQVNVKALQDDGEFSPVVGVVAKGLEKLGKMTLVSEGVKKRAFALLLEDIADDLFSIMNPEGLGITEEEDEDLMKVVDDVAAAFGSAKEDETIWPDVIKILEKEFGEGDAEEDTPEDTAKFVQDVEDAVINGDPAVITTSLKALLKAIGNESPDQTDYMEIFTNQPEDLTADGVFDTIVDSFSKLWENAEDELKQQMESIKTDLVKAHFSKPESEEEAPEQSDAEKKMNELVEENAIDELLKGIQTNNEYQEFLLDKESDTLTLAIAGSQPDGDRIEIKFDGNVIDGDSLKYEPKEEDRGKGYIVAVKHSGSEGKYQLIHAKNKDKLTGDLEAAKELQNISEARKMIRNILLETFGRKKKDLHEEIARSHQTVDNDPVQFDEHEDVNVEMYANDEGQWSVRVDCVSDPSMSFPMRKFPDEYSAKFYARQCCDRIVRKGMNEARRLVRRMILETLADDLSGVTSGREAKQIFAKYVDQSEFEKGALVHWVGSTRNLKKILENPRTKDELSCNFYPAGGYRDWMARGPKKPIGVIIEGHVTYAGKENMFTGYAKRPRKKAERAAYDHRQASSGINKYPYQINKDDEDYLDKLRNPNVPKTLASEMEPYGVKRDLGDDAWMFGMMGGSSKKPYQDWNEVLVDNWKVVGVVYGGVGRYGLSERQVKSIKEIASQYGFRAHKIGKMI